MHRNIALLLLLAATLVAGSAEARAPGGSGGAGAAAAKMTRGAQVRLNRMKQKMALRPRGAMMQKTRRMLRLGKKRMVRAMGRRQTGVSKTQLMRSVSRREIGLGGSESERTRARFARNVEDPADMGPSPEMLKKDAKARHGGIDNEEEVEKLGLKQRRKMRVSAKRRAIKAFKNLRRRD